MNQLALLPTTSEERFEKFHAENPGVYSMIVHYARQLNRRGIERYSIKGIVERVRFEIAQTNGEEPYKINNNYTAFYSRKVMADCPDLAGFFETRKQTTGG